MPLKAPIQIPVPYPCALAQELDDYAPEPEVHKFLYSRLMHFDVATLYELHYNSITLGKVAQMTWGSHVPSVLKHHQSPVPEFWLPILRIHHS